MCSCKNWAHVANYCNYKLSRDIEKNPGPPTYVDPNKTIVASYSQGNESLPRAALSRSYLKATPISYEQ